MSEDFIWLLEAGYLDPFGTPRVLRSTTGSDFMTKPTEQPPNTSYLPTLLTPGIIERHAWAKYTTRGQSVVGWGSPTLDNSAGQYDALKACDFGGQPLILRRGPRVGNYPQDYPAYFTGTSEGGFFPWRQLQLLLRDSLGLFNSRTLQTALYGGTNALPNGVDGVSGDLQGKYKPTLLGSGVNFAPPCVNTSKPTYQVHDRSIINLGAVTISWVRDAGVLLTQGTKYATVALLEAATTAPDHWDWCDDPIAGTFFKLGSNPAGNVTCAASSAINTVAGILTAILTGPGGIDASLIFGAADLDSQVSGVVGKWFDTSQYYCGDVIKIFTDCCNAYLVDSRDGTWRMGRLSVPTMRPQRRFQRYQVKDGGNGINVIQGNDLGDDAPQVTSNTPALSKAVWRVIVNYDFNETVQTESDIDGAAGLPWLGYVKQQYRQVVIDDPTILVRHPTAVVLTINTVFRDIVSATGEGDAQLALRREPPTVLELPLHSSDAEPLDLLKEAFGIDVGRLDFSSLIFLPIGFTDDPGDPTNKSLTTVVGWGVPDPTAVTQMVPATFLNPVWGLGLPTFEPPVPFSLEDGGQFLAEDGEVILTE